VQSWGPKVVKMADLKIFSTDMHVIKRLMVNFDTARQYKFCPDRFLIFVLVWLHVTFKVRLLWEVNRQSSVELIYCYLLLCKG